MGRRAADPATPVPVLGVPASVGGWKTTGGDRGGGVLLQTWGQCSVGVQTSPGISRPPAQLPDTPSDNITQTSVGGIAKAAEVTSLQTRNSNEKRAILRQKSGETKIKKEVTFKALGGDTSKDGGIYCYATAIRTNPLIAGSVTSSRATLKCATRYLNGSVVDSEAIGGISVVNDESDLCYHNAAPSGKVMPLSAVQPSAPQKVCNLCGGRQSAILGESANLREKTLKPVLTTRHFQASSVDTKLQQNLQVSQGNSDRKTQITDNPGILSVNEKLIYRKIPHPACPVHSRGNMLTLSRPHGASDGTSIQPATILHTKTTKATIEYLAEPPQDTSLNLTARVTNSPHSHTYPKLLKTTHLKSVKHNDPQDICVFVHSTPDNTLTPKSSTIAVRSANPSYTDTHKTSTAFNPYQMSSDSKINAEPEKQVSKATISSKNLQQATKSNNHTLKSDPPPYNTPASPPEPNKPLEKPTLSRVSPLPGRTASIDTVISQAEFSALTNPPHTTAAHSLLSTAVSRITSNHKANPDQITFTSTKHKSVASQIHSTQLKSSTSEPAVHTSASFLHKASHASKPPDSRAELPVAIYPDALHKNVARRSITFHLKKAAGSLLSPLTERQKNVSASSTCSLQLTDTTKVLGCNGAPDSSRAHRTQAANARRQESNEPRAQGVIPNQESNSRTASELQNVSESLNKRDVKSTITPTLELCSNTNKFRDNLINELVKHEPKECENSNQSQVTNILNSISLIKSSSSCPQGCLNAKQKRLAHYQGYAETTYEGRCATSPPVKTDSHTHQFPQGATASHAHSELKPNADRQTSNSPSVTTQTKCEPINSHTQMRPINTSPACQNSNLDITLQKQTHTSPEHPVPAPALEGERRRDTGPGCESVLPLFTMLLASSEVEENNKLDSKFYPRVPESYPEDSILAHSHPADAAPMLPSTLQHCRSAALEQRLKAVEASLAANKDRITTLLNIIYDLETVSALSNQQTCCKTGLDLKSCSTCQKTACIVYSVEYDFRQQERHFMEVLNHSGENNAFSERLTQPLNFSLLKNVVVKNLTKTKLKSKKLCKTLLKWLPRKIQQL